MHHYKGHDSLDDDGDKCDVGIADVDTDVDAVVDEGDDEVSDDASVFYERGAGWPYLTLVISETMTIFEFKMVMMVAMMIDYGDGDYHHDASVF